MPILSVPGGDGSNVIANMASFSMMLTSVDPSVRILKNSDCSHVFLRSFDSHFPMKSIIIEPDISYDKHC